MGIVEEEADESSLWLDLLVAAGIGAADAIGEVREEADQLTAIAVASIRTARGIGRDVPRSAFRVPR